MNLARSKDGRTIHRTSCQHADRGQPWNWASGKPLMEVARWAEELDLMPCRTCWPFGRRHRDA